ncbi:hypothetical protein C1N70_06185 [Cytobacillus firmus]
MSEKQKRLAQPRHLEGAGCLRYTVFKVKILYLLTLVMNLLGAVTKNSLSRDVQISFPFFAAFVTS